VDRLDHQLDRRRALAPRGIIPANDLPLAAGYSAPAIAALNQHNDCRRVHFFMTPANRRP
jgi:hypothetical protein